MSDDSLRKNRCDGAVQVLFVGSLSLFPSGLPIVCYALTQVVTTYNLSRRSILLPSLSRKVQNARAYVVVENAKAFFHHRYFNRCDVSERVS
jgi:hypothetical protein